MRMMRGFLAVAAILFVVTAVSAEMTTTGQVAGSQAPNWPDQSTLYDQTANATFNLSSCQDFEAAYDAYDAEGADDFVVTWADGWMVEQVGIIAGYWNGAGPANSIDVVFYDDAAGMPGSTVAGCSFMNNGYTDDGSSNFLMDFSGTPCYLPAGTYWVGIQGNVDFATGGQFGWGLESVQTGAGGVWRNPLDGFGSGCTSWTPRGNCSTIADPDYSFVILGENAVGATPTPPPPSGALNPVPALSSYGIVAMVLMIVGIAVFLMWRRN